MATVELRHTAALLRALPTSTPDAAASAGGRAAAGGRQAAVSLAAQCDALAEEVERAIATYGTLPRADAGGAVYAYEVDGFGNAVYMDDANVPSLLSLPYLGFVDASDPTYRRTRALLLSNATNPWFFSGSAGEGVGGPHSYGADWIWPMSLIMRALTSSDDSEIAAQLRMLKAAAAGTGLMHESFYRDDASQFTRKWFAWANSLFGELIVRLSEERPKLIGIPSRASGHT